MSVGAPATDLPVVAVAGALRSSAAVLLAPRRRPLLLGALARLAARFRLGRTCRTIDVVVSG